MGQEYTSLEWSRFHYYVVYTHPITNIFSKIDLLQQNFDQVSCLEWKFLRVLSFLLIYANFNSMEKCNWILNNPIACFPATSKYVFSWQIYFWIYHLIILVFLHVLLTCVWYFNIVGGLYWSKDSIVLIWYLLRAILHWGFYCKADLNTARTVL